ncbi:MAG: TlyA family RNA methyltransferase [Firmicutes bacterium]|nr:TlyA family RNA methyltransferase [Bacillota bacterium]
MRLDHYLVENQIAKTRSQATDLIKRGLVLVNGEVVTKTGYEVTTHLIKLVEEVKYVSRAGEKLYQAIQEFGIVLHDKIVVDIGSSTGGFTDCALQEGAKKVYSYDVGSNQMDIELKKDPRIDLHEETNILDVTIPICDVILIDVSFTSIKPIFNHLKGFSKEIIALIKPQFEVGHIHFKQGVVKDIKRHREVLTDVLNHARSLGFSIKGLKKSDLKGKAGNQEYILYIAETKNQEDIKNMIGDVLC